MPTITGLSAYVPRDRLPREEVARAWGSGAATGSKAVASYDEDSLTMAVAAALDCSEGAPPDAVWFASTTSPYLEKQSAAILAAAVDAPRSAFTVDVAASLRGWSSALRAAADALAGGSAARGLVAVGDTRPAVPDSPDEGAFGDGGGAALLEPDGRGAELVASASVNDNTLGSWRRAGDDFVRHGELRFALRAGQVAPAVEAAHAALQRAGLPADAPARLAVAAPDPRVAGALEKELQTGARIVEGPLDIAGSPGAALGAVMLSRALAEAEEGEIVMLVAVGDGAEALLLRAGEPPRGVERLEELLATGRPVSSYEHYLQRRSVLPKEVLAPRSSPVVQRREEGQYLRFHGMRCGSCGTLQYPIAPLCAHCASERLEEVRLSRSGTVHTFTTDYIVAGVNPGLGESPITMAVVDLDDGARVFLQMTDANEDEMSVGMPVEACFRMLHEGSDYHNYYWKARPLLRARAGGGTRAAVAAEEV